MHIPVLQKELIDYLNPEPDENFIDCTAGFLGHAMLLLEKNGPKGKMLAIERDPVIFKSLLKSKTERLVLVNDSFVNLEKIVEENKLKKVSGILFDLGLSSWHLKESERGFSFQRNETLDMRYNPADSLTAEKILNYWSLPEIEKNLKEYGEERFAGKIAGKIIEERKKGQIKSTSQLVRIIKEAVPQKYQHQRIHFATRTFQALRIAVNDELKNLEIALPQAADILTPGGKMAVISFHSLEDRIVKNFFKQQDSQKWEILTKKPVVPTKKEIKINPRSRSAKMRVIKKI